jgi:hypothetical protein
MRAEIREARGIVILRNNWICLSIALFCVLAKALIAQEKPVELAREPHHRLLLENSSARIFRLTLQPQEATLRHRHSDFYLYLSVGPSTVSNEVKGRKPVISELGDGDLRTSKGGFSLTERNVGDKPLEIVVIETKGSGDAVSFQSPMANFRYHDTAVGSLYEGTNVRVYELDIASGGRTELHAEPYDRLTIALKDIHLRDQDEKGKESEIEEKTGDVAWWPKGKIHATTNVGGEPARFVTVEFAQ